MTKQAKSCPLSFYMTYSHGDSWQAREDFSGGLLQSSLFQGALVNFHSSQKASTRIICQSLSGIFTYISIHLLEDSVKQCVNSRTEMNLGEGEKGVRGGTAREGQQGMHTQPFRPGHPALSLPLPQGLLSFLSTF